MNTKKALDALTESLVVTELLSTASVKLDLPALIPIFRDLACLFFEWPIGLYTIDVVN